MTLFNEPGCASSHHTVPSCQEVPSGTNSSSVTVSMEAGAGLPHPQHMLTSTPVSPVMVTGFPAATLNGAALAVAAKTRIAATRVTTLIDASRGRVDEDRRSLIGAAGPDKSRRG